MLKRKWMEIFSAERIQWLFFFVLSVVIFGLTLCLYLWDKTVFSALLGNTNPLLVVAGSALAGLVCFVLLLSKGWFAILQPFQAKGYLAAVGLSVFFAINAILLDAVFRFSETINVLPPKGLLYYPVMGFIVEMLFHILLVTILSLALKSIFPAMEMDKIIWITVVIVAIVEPVFQVVVGSLQDGLTLFAVLTGVHIFLINLGQLYVFKRYGFSTMFFLRMVYYLWWHILWGTLRLGLLF